MTQTVQFETDNFPTAHHILIVKNNGELVQQVKVRDSRDYSEKYMLQRSFEILGKSYRNKESDIKD